MDAMSSLALDMKMILFSLSFLLRFIQRKTENHFLRPLGRARCACPTLQEEWNPPPQPPTGPEEGQTYAIEGLDGGR
jgi:hypothetical protein